MSPGLSGTHLATGLEIYSSHLVGDPWATIGIKDTWGLGTVGTHCPIVARKPRHDLVQKLSKLSSDLWAPEYDLMMDQIQWVEGSLLGDHDLEV